MGWCTADTINVTIRSEGLYRGEAPDDAEFFSQSFSTLVD